MHYKIEGNPVPLARPRFSQGHVWDCQTTEKLRDGLAIKLQHGKSALYSSPLHLEVTFIFGVPQSYSNAKKLSMLQSPHIKKPDLDNLVKYLMDICIGIIYTDDKFVTSITAHKQYGSSGLTVFSFTEL